MNTLWNSLKHAAPPSHCPNTDCQAIASQLGNQLRDMKRLRRMLWHRSPVSQIPSPGSQAAGLEQLTFSLKLCAFEPALHQGIRASQGLLGLRALFSFLGGSRASTARGMFRACFPDKVMMTMSYQTLYRSRRPSRFHWQRLHLGELGEAVVAPLAAP